MSLEERYAETKEQDEMDEEKLSEYESVKSALLTPGDFSHI